MDLRRVSLYFKSRFSAHLCLPSSNDIFHLGPFPLELLLIVLGEKRIVNQIQVDVI